MNTVGKHPEVRDSFTMAVMYGIKSSITVHSRVEGRGSRAHVLIVVFLMTTFTTVSVTGSKPENGVPEKQS